MKSPRYRQEKQTESYTIIVIIVIIVIIGEKSYKNLTIYRKYWVTINHRKRGFIVIASLFLIIIEKGNDNNDDNDGNDDNDNNDKLYFYVYLKL